MAELHLPLRSGPEVDRLYAELIAAQADLDDEAAADWLARLTVILCQHIGDAEVLRRAFALAREPSMPALAPGPSTPALAPGPSTPALAPEPSTPALAHDPSGTRHD